VGPSAQAAVPPARRCGNGRRPRAPGRGRRGRGHGALVARPHPGHSHDFGFAKLACVSPRRPVTVPSRAEPDGFQLPGNLNLPVTQASRTVSPTWRPAGGSRPLDVDLCHGVTGQLLAPKFKFPGARRIQSDETRSGRLRNVRFIPSEGKIMILLTPLSGWAVAKPRPEEILNPVKP
jgi:hypothetical protein